MTASEELIALLKHKGIGPEGSKSLSPAQLTLLTPLLNDNSISLITRATMLTAMVMLDPTDAEEKWILDHQPFDEFLPKELTNLFTQINSPLSELNLEVIQHQDLSEEDALLGAQLLLDSAISDPEKAIFLEGQRLKRESFEENLNFFSAFNQAQESQEIDLDELILFGDSFDGCKRINPYTVFSCCVLASLGIHSYMTGLDRVAPKNGITAHQILKEVQIEFPTSIPGAREELIQKGWSYLDQSVTFPELHALISLREEMVKRPFLATFEKMLFPIKGRKNYLVTAYTHKAYRTQVVELNQHLKNVDRMLNIKGVEATSRPHLDRPSDFVKFSEGFISDGSFIPVASQIEASKESATVQETIKLGSSALNGEKNLAYAVILNQCVLVLTEILNWERAKAIEQVQNVLDSGAAFAKWK